MHKLKTFFLALLLSSFIAPPLLASDQESLEEKEDESRKAFMSFINETPASYWKTWERSKSVWNNRESYWKEGWGSNGWSKFTEKLNEHGPLILKEVKHGENRRQLFQHFIEDIKQPIEYRIFACFFLLERIADYVKGQYEAAEKVEEKQAKQENRARRYIDRNDLNKQDNIAKRLAQAKSTLLLLSGFMLDLHAKYQDDAEGWIQRSATFLDCSSPEELKVENLARSWWERVVSFNTTEKFGFSFSLFKNIAQVLLPHLQAPFTRAILGEKAQVSEEEAYGYFRYVGGDKLQAFAQEDLRARLAALNKATAGWDTDIFACFYAYQAHAAVVGETLTAREPSWLGCKRLRELGLIYGQKHRLQAANLIAASLVKKILEQEDIPQREELVVRALSHFAPMHLADIPVQPTFEDLQMLSSWVVLFEHEKNQGELIQNVLGELVGNFPDVFKALRYYNLYRSWGYDKITGLQYIVPEGHPSLAVKEAESPVKQCEELLRLARSEKDPEIAYLLARCGRSIARRQADTAREKSGEYAQEIRRLREKHQKSEWGDAEVERNHFHQRDSKDKKEPSEFEKACAKAKDSMEKLQVLRQKHRRDERIYGDYEGILAKKRTEFKNSEAQLKAQFKKDMGALEEIAQKLSMQAEALKTLQPTFDKVCADLSYALAQSKPNFGGRRWYKEKWFGRAANRYLDAADAAGLAVVWPHVRKPYEEAYARPFEEKQRGDSDKWAAYWKFINLLCLSRLNLLVEEDVPLKGLDLTFLPEGHFLCRATQTDDSAECIRIVQGGLKSEKSLAHENEVKDLSAAFILQASKHLFEKNESEENRVALLQAYEDFIKRFNDYWHRTTPLKVLKSFLDFTKNMEINDLPESLIMALGEDCCKALSEETGPIYKFLDDDQIAKLRRICLRHFTLRARDKEDRWVIRGSAAFPLGHPARAVLNMCSIMHMDNDETLLQAAQLYALARKESDPELKLLLLKKAEDVWGTLHYQLGYDKADSLWNKGSLLEVVAGTQAYLDEMPTVERTLETMWHNLFDQEEERLPKDILSDIRSQIRNGHKKSMSILSRSQESIPEAAALKKAFLPLKEKNSYGREDINPEELSKTLRLYCSALKAFCDKIWGLRDDINRDILGIYTNFARSKDGTAGTHWQLRTALFANALLKVTPSATEMEAFEEECEREQIPLERVLFVQELNSENPVVVSPKAFAGLTQAWADLLAYSEKNKLPEDLSKQLMKSLPEDIAQIGSRFIEPKVSARGCIAYFTAQMYLKRLQAEFYGAQKKGEVLQNVAQLVDDYYAAVEASSSAFYARPKEDFFSIFMAAHSFDSTDAASNIVVLRIVHETYEMLDSLKAFLKGNAPEGLDQKLSRLKERAVDMAGMLRFGRLAGSDASYFRGGCYLKIASMYDDPLSRFYFVSLAKDYFDQADYKDDIILDDVDKFGRMFYYDRNKASSEKSVDRMRLNIAEYALQACLKAIESDDLFAALNYKQAALALNPESEVPVDNGVFGGLEDIVQKRTKEVDGLFDKLKRDLESAKSEKDLESKYKKAKEQMFQLKAQYKKSSENFSQAHPYAHEIKGVTLPGAKAIQSVLKKIEAHEEALRKLAKVNLAASKK